LFSKIITNPSHFDEQGRLRVARFHGLDKPPHGCPRPCAANLCKGQEFQKLIDSQHWDRIVYMGDSTNDFCPSTRLQRYCFVVHSRGQTGTERTKEASARYPNRGFIFILFCLLSCSLVMALSWLEQTSCWKRRSRNTPRWSRQGSSIGPPLRMSSPPLGPSLTPHLQSLLLHPYRLSSPKVYIRQPIQPIWA